MKKHAGGPVPMKQPWRCIHCAATGVVTIMSTAFCDQIFAAVEDAHQEADPVCAGERGNNGLALDRMIPPVPKKKGDHDQTKQAAPAEDSAQAFDEADTGA